MDAFGLNFCHGLGLGLHERPLISRLTSLQEPIELKAGMVFAVETYCPASDGFSAARIEEEVILTPSGPQIISLYRQTSCRSPILTERGATMDARTPDEIDTLFDKALNAGDIEGLALYERRRR
jgi:hypothetical protein